MRSKNPFQNMALRSFFDDILPRFEYLLPPFEFFLPYFDVLLPLVDFLLPFIMSWLHVYPLAGDDPGIHIKTALKNSAAGRVLSNLDNEYKRVNFLFR